MGNMNKPLFDLNQRDLQIEVDSYKPGNGLIWPILFPLKHTRSFDLKGISGKEGIPIAAERVAFNVKAPLKTRKTIGSWSGTLDKIAVSRDKNELDINEYEDLKVLAANSDDPEMAQELVDMIFDDVEFCNEAMDYRNEIDALRIGCLGIKTYDPEIDGENATADTINFNVPSQNFVGIAKPWSNYAEADGLGDIIAKQKLIKGKNKPKYAFMEEAGFSHLISQDKTKTRCASLLVSALNMEGNSILTLDVVNSYMNKHGFPQIVVFNSEATIEDKEGNEVDVKPWFEHIVVLSPVPRLGYSYYKPVPMVKDTAAMQVRGSYYKLTRYSDVNPMQEVTLTEAYIQPALDNRASLVFINTAKTTWNNGSAT
ncbi:MAG: major capsid protein [Bacteroidales bacterium]|nr:major capsid protein [Bacteroidales bacterium]